MPSAATFAWSSCVHKSRSLGCMPPSRPLLTSMLQLLERPVEGTSDAERSLPNARRKVARGT